MFKSRTFVVGLIVLSVGLAIVAFVREHILRVQLEQVEHQLTVTEERWVLSAQDLATAQHYLNGVVDNLLHEYGRDDYPISEESYDSLEKVLKFYNNFIQKNHHRVTRRENTAIRRLCAGAYISYGRICIQIGQLKGAEIAFRSARRLYLEFLEEDSRPEWSFYLSEIDNLLSHLLAVLGRAEESHQFGLAAKSCLEKLVAEFPKETEYRSLQAFVLSNLALLTHGAENDPESESYYRQALVILRNLSDDHPESLRFRARLIDSQQFFAGYLARKGKLHESKRFCDLSVKTIERFSVQKDETSPGLRDLETAREAASVNQRRIERYLSAIVDQDEGKAVPGGSPSPRMHISDWAWRPLSAHSSRRIPAEILVRGNLHADFEAHDALLLSAPALNDKWQPLLIQVVAAAWQQIQVFILVPDENAEELLMAKLRDVGVPDHGVRFFCMPTYTPWVRDYGPLVITTDVGVHRFVDARYATKDRSNDDHVPARLSRLARVPKLTTPLAIPGGNLLTNGNGLCVTTTRLLQENEAHGFSEEYVTNSIKRIFGATEVIYLKPLVGEGTGHVDMFAAFTDPRTIVVGDYHGIDPINAKVLDDNAERLAKIRTKTGPLKVVRIPMPPKQEDSIGTYTNIVFANGVVIVPTWSSAARETEEQVLATYRRLLPGRKIVPIDASTMGLMKGAFRCATMPLHRITLTTEKPPDLGIGPLWDQRLGGE